MYYLLGRELNIVTLPWAYFVLADPLPESDPEYSPINRFQNYWGYEIDMLKTAAKHFNFTYTLNQPEAGVWTMQSAKIW